MLKKTAKKEKMMGGFYKKLKKSKKIKKSIDN